MDFSTTIIENELIAKLAEGFPRDPAQLNRLRESDAELIRLPGTEAVLAMTTDSIVEEIESGLYADPYLIGWMTVIVNASDLAAVGAEPLGLLLNQTLTAELDETFLLRLQTGVRDGCRASGLYVLGGDVNFSSRLQMTGTAVGIVRDGKPLTRRGCVPGDRLFASGALGLGSAYAFLQLASDSKASIPSLRYQPQARLREGRLLRQHAGCAMDTSDGVIPTLDELMRLNGVGFRLDAAAADILHSDALRVARSAQLPAWLMLAGPHGEFELLFSVAADRLTEFRTAADAFAWVPIELGVVTDQPGKLVLKSQGELLELDSARARNLFLEVQGDIGAYVKGLLRIDAEARRLNR